MRYVLSSQFVVALVLSACADMGALPPVIDDAGPVSFRSGVTDIAANSLNGEFACFTLKHACDTPEEVHVKIDGQTVFSWTPPNTEDCFSDSIDPAPSTYCHSAESLSSGSHTFQLLDTCASVQTSDSLSASLSPPPFRLRGVTPNQLTYSRNDTVELEIDAGATGLTVTADFSPLDTHYTTGAETVTSLGSGKYKISYAIDSRNTRVPGDYLVPVTLSGSSTTAQGNVPIRWIPRGFPRVSPVVGAYSPANAQTRSADTTTNHSVTLGTTTQATAAAREMFSTSQTDDGVGRSFTLAFNSATPPGDRIRVEMRDGSRDGTFIATYPVQPEPTDPTRYMVSGRLSGSPLHSSVSYNFRLVHPNGTASSWINQTLNIGWPGVTGEVMAFGTLGYQYLRCRPDTTAAGELDESPEIVKETCAHGFNPARRIMVELTDQCNQSHRSYVNEDGSFLLWLNDNCSEAEMLVTAHSITRPGNGERIAISKWNGDPIDGLSELTTDPDDYLVHSAVIGSFTPPTGTSSNDLGYLMLYTASNGDMAGSAYLIDGLTQSIDYFANFVDRADIHPLNAVYTDFGVLDDGLPTYVVSVHPALWYFPPKANDMWIAAHEFAHYIHKFFLDDAFEYGRFSEPMANTNAAGITRDPWFRNFKRHTFENMDFNGHFTENIGGAGVDGFRQADLMFFADDEDYDDCHSRAGCCDVNDTPNPLCVLGKYGWIWRIFQDLQDGVGGEPETQFWVTTGGSMTPDYGQFDDVDGAGGSSDPHAHALADVMFGYLGSALVGQNPNRDDRGLESADPVDVLDGMLCRGHLSQLTAESLLNDAMDFDYDFLPAEDSCL